MKNCKNLFHALKYVIKRYFRILKARIGFVRDWTAAAKKLGDGWDNSCLDCEYYKESYNLEDAEPECDLFKTSLEFDTEWITEDADGRKPRGGGFNVLDHVYSCKECCACELSGIKRTLEFWKISKQYTKYY